MPLYLITEPNSSSWAQCCTRPPRVTVEEADSHRQTTGARSKCALTAPPARFPAPTPFTDSARPAVSFITPLYAPAIAAVDSCATETNSTPSRRPYSIRSRGQPPPGIPKKWRIPLSRASLMISSASFTAVSDLLCPDS